MKCEGFCAKCYANARRRSNYRGHFLYRSPKKKARYDVGKYAKKGGSAAAGSDTPAAWVIGNMEERFPALHEYMSLTVHDDGKKRETATVLLLCDAGSVKAWINDRDNQRAAWVTATNLEGLFLALEDGLQSDSLEWRASKPSFKKK